MTADDLRAVEQALPAAWVEMKAAELEVPLATLYADKLAAMPLTGDAAAISFELSLLSPDYESLSAKHAPTGAEEAFLTSLARGDLKGQFAPDLVAAAISAAFTNPVITSDFQVMLDQNRIGEVILLAMSRIEHGTSGDMRGVTEGLSVLRHIGLEDAARRTSLELMLLDRRG